MSFTYSYLAARCELPELQAAMLAAWPMLELAEPVREFASWDEAYQWAGPRSGYLSGAHPHDVKLLFRDGVWSVLADISICMADDAELLAQLSRRVGRVVSATTQGTAGFAQLLVFEAGAAIRSITGEGGRTVEAGAPLGEEAGIPLGVSTSMNSIRSAGDWDFHVPEAEPAARWSRCTSRSHSLSRNRCTGFEPRPWWKLW